MSAKNREQNWLQQEISYAKNRLDSRPSWRKSIDRFEGRNLPSATYGGKAHPPLSSHHPDKSQKEK